MQVLIQTDAAKRTKMIITSTECLEKYLLIFIERFDENKEKYRKDKLLKYDKK